MLASTCSFCRKGSSTVGVGAGPVFIHGRQDRHVAIVSLTKFMTSFGIFAAVRILSIAALGACHHLKCSFLTSFRFCSSVPVRSVLKLVSILNCDQSVIDSSTDKGCSRTTGASCGPLGPLGLLRERSPSSPDSSPSWGAAPSGGIKGSALPDASAGFWGSW